MNIIIIDIIVRLHIACCWKGTFMCRAKSFICVASFCSCFLFCFLSDYEELCNSYREKERKEKDAYNCVLSVRGGRHYTCRVWGRGGVPGGGVTSQTASISNGALKAPQNQTGGPKQPSCEHRRLPAGGSMDDSAEVKGSSFCRERGRVLTELSHLCLIGIFFLFLF